MTIDLIEALGLLEHAGIRVVRAKYVDSAGDAVAFATRRDARDPHVLPIVLSAQADEIVKNGKRLSASDALHATAAIHGEYERLAGSLAPAQRILATEFVAHGTDIALVYGRNDAGQEFLELRSGDHATEQLLPIDETGARLLVEHMLAHDHRGRSEKSRRMVEHLILRVCNLLDEFPIEELELDPIRLHENSYTVLRATIRSASRLRVEKRLANHARDRKAYGYRPSGRQ
jgi:hypothetical protein